MSYSDLGMHGGAVQQLKSRTNPLDAFNDSSPTAGDADVDAEPRQAARRSRLPGLPSCGRTAGSRAPTSSSSIAT